MREHTTYELTLAHDILPALRPGMLCLADRFFSSYQLWQAATRSGADLLWRIRQNARLDVDRRLADGSYQSWLYASTTDRRKERNVSRARLRLPIAGRAGRETCLPGHYFDAESATAPELAALSYERWEIETAISELKIHLRGAQIVLRSKTAALVEQEFYGLLMAHFAIRGLMHEAALKADEDPDRLSFLHSVPEPARREAQDEQLSAAAIRPSKHHPH